MNVLEYASPMQSPPRWRTILFNLRYVLLTFYVGLIIGAIVYIQDWQILIPLLILTALQGLFLVGMPHLRWPRATRKRAMITSQMIAAVVAASLTFGLFATLLSAFNNWDELNRSWGGNIFWVVAVAWLIWLAVFAVIWARQPFSGFTRIYKSLIAGTILEVLITIPVDVQVRKRTSCWCDEGTFVAYAIAACVALWTFGPGLVLLFLTRRLQREGYFSLCSKCGHDISATHEKRCPTCNARIPRNNRAQSML